jgi:hypothetical protein
VPDMWSLAHPEKGPEPYLSLSLEAAQAKVAFCGGGWHRCLPESAQESHLDRPW